MSEHAPEPQEPDHEVSQATTPAHPTPVDHPESPADSTTNTSRVMLFVILAIVVGSIALFLILRLSPPQQ